MTVVLASKIGFCFGVKRAVAMAENALAKKKGICSLGSIIHNRQVVDDLKRRGLKVIADPAKIRRGVLVISSHGISPVVASAIRRRGLGIVDTTCPFVLKAQRIAGKLAACGRRVVIVGDAGHPEVRALVDFAPGNAVVVKSKAEARKLRFGADERVTVISQTTQSSANFREAVCAIRARHPRAIGVINTICRDAEDRQSAARRLARKADVMLIVGGRNSANTRRLYEVSRKLCRASHHIETERDVRQSWFKPDDVVGITSGASTPDSVIEKVVQQVTNKTHKKGRL